MFESTEHFQQYFIESLEELLTVDELGAFILVLANAYTRQDILSHLGSTLKIRFDGLTRQIQKSSEAELQRLPADDVSVFLQLQDLGYEQLEATKHRYIGPWQLQYNPLRSFRPPRKSQLKIEHIYQPFDDQSFHFNKSFLTKEILWQGEVNGVNTRLLFNKFPFADYHGILLLDAELNKPQYLNQEDCQQLQQIQEGLGELKGLGLAYNSLGAYASVNHQHWQWFINKKAYPVELAAWRHNGGKTAYPVEIEVFEQLTGAWPRIESLQNKNQAFNLLVRPDKTYLAPRKNQGMFDSVEWAHGLAWSEVMGNFTAFLKETYNMLEETHIDQALTRIKV